ncbi:MAG: GNAT family N-acetyltransferase [Janthinobacterium lividum]
MVNAARLLALNNAHAEQTSLLGPVRLQRMIAGAFRVATIGDIECFLIAFDQDADYDSPNFLWLRARHDRFVYVDRIVTAPEARNRGHAARLYRDLFAQGTVAGHDRVLCEVNRVPPNPGSDAFHERLGFTEIGQATSAAGKTVRYLERRLTPADQTG